MKIAGFAAGPFQTNCYLMVNEVVVGGVRRTQAVVVDPGLGAHARAVELAEAEGAELVAVLLTHGHIDHVRDAAAFGVETFIHAADAFMLDPAEESLARLALPFDVATMKTTEHVTHVADGDVLTLAGVELRARHAPGHSPGSTLFLGADFVLSGDVLFRGSIGRTDLPYSAPEQMRESLRGPVWEIPDSFTVLPGHGPTTTMAHERTTNPYLLEANAALD
ncbi:MBL fold metallo-hydrolase [Corynebacterium timonense]|uniref:Glyoxylase, beta-lactamase superfamily II n=1 Tax=Corynebacterium timonense TaxID=441500 RepID=A0A1H1NLX5_9CORY|nr:MBL fold metallo-hydrolase [Corynebacterium timonense]SDR99917.1 Glyoxylase, beta-lactamase superfamily II [Corynebacterium timonense]